MATSLVGHDWPVMNLRVYCPAALAAEVEAFLSEHPGVGNLAVIEGGSKVPEGNLILADVAREAANEVSDALVALGIHREGGFHLNPLSGWASSRNLKAEQASPGSEADAVVWTEVTARAYDDTELTWTFLTFLTLATTLVSVAIVLDSTVLIIGAMVLGPDFGPVAAIGLALVRRRYELLRRALRVLAVGFALSIIIATAFAAVWGWLGWVDMDVIATGRSATDFIYHPNQWSIVIAVLAGIAGVLSLTSSASNALVGVFISVTTVPASGNIAIGLAFGQWDQVTGSALQLVINVIGMALAGWATLLVQQMIWQRVVQRPRR